MALAARGSWRVPAVQCDRAPLFASRAAPWVGISGDPRQDIWGSKASATQKGTWVAQAGTASRCVLRRPEYWAWTELYLDEGGLVQRPQGATKLFSPSTVQPGDRISVTVSYLGRQKDGTLKFITDLTDYDAGLRGQPSHDLHEWYTDPGVDVSMAASVGGCIVERQLSGGLAQFMTPIRFEALSEGQGGCEVAHAPYSSLGRYVMTASDKQPSKVLAEPSFPNASGEFSVTWKAWE